MNSVDNPVPGRASAVIVMDAAGCITEWDERVSVLTGLEAGEMLGRSLLDLLPEARARKLMRESAAAPAAALARRRHRLRPLRGTTGRDAPPSLLALRVIASVIAPGSYLGVLEALPVGAAARRQDVWS